MAANSKNGLPYYKRYPRDFIEATIGMSLELKGAYGLVLDLIYMQGGKLPDNPRYISGLLGCSMRKWKSIKRELIEEGKIVQMPDYLANKRAETELAQLSKFQEKQSKNRSGSNKNNELEKPSPDHLRDYSEPEPEEKDKSFSDTPDFEDAFNAYNATAELADLPKAQKLTDTRRAQIKARLRDCGGLDGWHVAMSKLEASDFCTGKVNGWKADLDFVLQAKSFTRLMEGSYDNRETTPALSAQENTISNLRKILEDDERNSETETQDHFDSLGLLATDRRD